MKIAQFAKSYQAVAVTTASPGNLVLMLFDGALRFLSTAEHAFQGEEIFKRYEDIHNNLIKTQRILRELQCSLDLKAGGEFATRMYALYEFMIEELRKANMAKGPGPIQTVSRLLGEIRDAWGKMLEQSQSQAA